MPARMTELRPMLAVTDLRRTIAFYRDRLGFTLDETFAEPAVWCSMHRDEVHVMFNAPPSEDVRRDVSPRSRDYQIYYINSPDVAALRDGFPGGDPESHRRYHESIIEWRELRNRMVKEALIKAAQAGSIGALGWIAYAVWTAFKMEIMK